MKETCAVNRHQKIIKYREKTVSIFASFAEFIFLQTKAKNSKINLATISAAIISYLEVFNSG